MDKVAQLLALQFGERDLVVGLSGTRAGIGNVEPGTGPQVEGAVGDAGGKHAERDAEVDVVSCHAHAHREAALSSCKDVVAGIGHFPCSPAEGAGDEYIVVGVVLQGPHIHVGQPGAEPGPGMGCVAQRAEDARAVPNENRVDPAVGLGAIHDSNRTDVLVAEVARDVVPGLAGVGGHVDVAGVNGVGRHPVVGIDGQADNSARAGQC